MAIYKNGGNNFNGATGMRTKDNFIDEINKQTSAGIKNIFQNTKDFKDVTSYRLTRGVPDFGSLVQFNPYESGYAAFIICGMPKFIIKLAESNAYYNKLVQNWQHLVEYEFKSFDGLADITADAIELGDDLNKLEVISKVNMQSSTDFSLSYEERSGSIFTKFAKLYLTGIKDPRTQVKTYHGLIHNGVMEPGFENEVFTFLFIACDNTMREVEAAYLIIGAQLRQADTSMYNYTKGEIDKKPITLTFNGYPITSSTIEGCAKEVLTFLITDADPTDPRKIIINSTDESFSYTGVDAIAKTLSNYVGGDNKLAEKYPISSAALGNDTTSYTADRFYNETSGFGFEPTA